MKHLNETQIALIHKMGPHRWDNEQFSAGEIQTLGSLITAGFIIKVRGRQGWGAWQVENYYDLIDSVEA